MELTETEINDFILSWKQDFGEDLTPERARSEALRLLDFFDTLDNDTAARDESPLSPDGPITS